MQVSLDKIPPQKVKNILIRSFTVERQNNAFLPEASHILKYAPKYYQTLTIRIKPFSPLLSKIKKIKKLKKLQKLENHIVPSSKEIFPQNLWLNILSNSRKTIEEIPQISPKVSHLRLKLSFWKRANLQTLKFFPNATRVLLSKYRDYMRMNHSDPLISMKEQFVLCLWMLRRLKTLEIVVKGDNYEEAKRVFKKLNGARRLLDRLETLLIRIEDNNLNASELLENKNLFSHVTDLIISAPFHPAFAEIPHICKKLEYLSLEFRNNVGQRPEFSSLLTSLEDLQQLKNIKFCWPEDARNFWKHFKPGSSLRQLTLIFNVLNLIEEGLFAENIEPSKDVIAHWEEIQELDALTFDITCTDDDHIPYVKQFVTMILKKIRKVHCLKLSLANAMNCEEPFLVEEVPHLHETLESFECSWSNLFLPQECAIVDLRMMKPFRNLKELKLNGALVTFDNVEEVVSLLEESQEATLEIKSEYMISMNWLGKTLKKIESVRRVDKDLKMLIDLNFRTNDIVDITEKLCQDIQAVGVIKGLVISLTICNLMDISPLPVEKLREVLKKYGGVRNLKLVAANVLGNLRFHRIDGEREQMIYTE